MQILSRLILSAAALLAGTVFSQGVVSLQPNAIIHSGTPGSSITQSLRIDNPGSTALDISIYPGDWQHDSGGQIVYYPSGTLEQSAAGWLSFDRDSLHVEASGITAINYTVTIPADAAPGSYWAALFAEGTQPGAGETQAMTTFRVRTAHMVYVNVPPATGGGRITGILGHRPDTPDSPYRMQLTYLNEGNTVQTLTGTVEIRTVAGELVDTVTIGRQMALPGIARNLSLEVYGPVPAGDYLALAVLNYGDIGVDVAGEFVFQLDQSLAEPQFMFEEAAERARLEQERLERERALLEQSQ